MHGFKAMPSVSDKSTEIAEPCVEANCPYSISCYDEASGILRSVREVPPTHYTLTIESFSLFASSNIERYESGLFEAGGYKWKLSLYPKGNKNKDVSDHLSIYLVVEGINSLPVGWEVQASFKFFLHDHIRDKYLAIQDARSGLRRFNRMKTEWGFDKFFPLATFNDASNGFLHDDCCVFGAEVFVIKYSGRGQSLSTKVIDPEIGAYTWTINRFSAISVEYLCSDVFTYGDHKWKLLLYPKGNITWRGKSLSLFLESFESESLASGTKVYAEYTLRARDQFFGNHFESKGEHWFSSSSMFGSHANFLSLTRLNTLFHGHLVDDTLILEVQITHVSCSKNF